MSRRVKDYWDRRAREAAGKLEATTNDIWLRELEVNTIVETLKALGLDRDARLADLGCGDGLAAVRIARAFPELSVLGLDYSENMLELARQRLRTEMALHPEIRQRVTFVIGDVTKLDASLGDQLYEVILTDRCLINLDSQRRQYDAIRQIAEHVKPGGTYIAIENFVEGHNNMNAARRSVGIEEIPIRWHNLYFSEKKFVSRCEKYFDHIEISDFSSSYYFATRVIYSALCWMQGVEPDYNHEIHQLAVRLPSFGQLSPIRMSVMRRR